VGGLIWAVIDAYKIFGWGEAVLLAAMGVVLFPFLMLILAVYLIQRNARLERQETDPSWQKELDRMQRGEVEPATPKTAPKPEISFADHDPGIEDLIAKGNVAGALKLAKERAAHALGTSDFAAARVYERYLERLRRGMK
jgi:hypothetical protein